jgi:serralysin
VFRSTRAVDKPAPVGTPKAAIAYAKKWAQNRELKIKFLGGQAEVWKKVQQQAEEWMEHVNIKFRFVTSGPAEIRIAFDRTVGSWSYMGTDNLTIPTERPTMNFGWLYPDSDQPTYSSVVLHEFGHMLGMIHEHQSPAGGIRWNRQRVIDDCWRTHTLPRKFLHGRSSSDIRRGEPAASAGRAQTFWEAYQGWDAEQVQRQIFDRYPREQTQFTKLDLTSIMMYPFPKEWSLDGTGTPWNTKLSALDIDFMSRQYPKA